jgi:20S proteasome subunit alpha 5
VALLVAGVDSENGPALFHTDPSGTFVQYEAKAIGAGSEGAQSTLQDKYSKVCSCSFALLSQLLLLLLRSKLSRVTS